MYAHAQSPFWAVKRIIHYKPLKIQSRIIHYELLKIQSRIMHYIHMYIHVHKHAKICFNHVRILHTDLCKDLVCTIA